MQDLMFKLQDMILCDIDEITKKGSIKPEEYEMIGEAVDILKDLKTIEAMDEYGESPEMSGYMPRYRMNGGYSGNYGSYGNGNTMPAGNSTMRGRDARTGRYMSRDDGTMAKLSNMMATAQTEQERQIISRMMNELGM